MQLNNTTPTENPNIQVETYFTEQLNIKTLHKAMTNIGWSIKADYDNIAFLNPEERAELEEVINKMLNNKNIAQQTEIINYNISQLGQVIMMDNSTSLDNSSKNFQFAVPVEANTSNEVEIVEPIETEIEPVEVVETTETITK